MQIEAEEFHKLTEFMGRQTKCIEQQEKEMEKQQEMIAIQNVQIENFERITDISKKLIQEYQKCIKLTDVFLDNIMPQVGSNYIAIQNRMGFHAMCHLVATLKEK